MKKLIILLIISALSFSLFARGPRHGREGPRDPGNFWLNSRVLEEAGIPDKQQEEIRKKGHEAKKELMDIGFKVRELMKQSRDEFLKEKPSIKKLKKLNGQIAELRKKQVLLMGRTKIEILASFTTEQRKKILELVREYRENFMNRMRGNGRGRHGGPGGPR